MGYILMALFGGGTLDWEHISKTKYDWEDIFDRAKENYDFDNIDMCQLYETILEMALDELQEKMEEIADECSEELAEEIQEKLEDEIDDINFKIGFADIEF